MSRPILWVRRAAAALALAASGIVITGVMLEATLRLFHPETLLHDPDAFVPDPVLGGRLRPGWSDVFSSGEYATRWVINAAGYRGPQAGPRRSGVTRVVAIGDSFTFGYGVEESESYPRVLEALLNAPAPDRFEVFNLGVGGYGLVQELAWLKENLDRGLEPDIVIFGFYPGNDLSDSVRGAAGVSGAVQAGGGGAGAARISRAERLKRWLGARSHLFALISERADGLLIRLGLRNVVYPEEVEVLLDEPPRQTEEGWTLVRKSLGDLASLASSRRFRTLVMIVPMRHQVVPESWERVKSYYSRITGRPLQRFDLDQPQRRLSELCREAGIPVLDPARDFRAAAEPARLYFKRDQHWTAGGHALAAREIDAWLRNDAVQISGRGQG